MREFFPSRVLNDHSYVLGLGLWDLMGASLTLFPARYFLHHTPFEALTLFVPGLFLCALVPIRLNFRAKVVRDFLFFHLSKKAIRCLDDL